MTAARTPASTTLDIALLDVEALPSAAERARVLAPQLKVLAVTPRGRSNVYTLCCEVLAAPVRLLATLAALTPEGGDACGDPTDG